MQGWHNFKDKLRRYYKFSPKEFKSLAITIITATFIFSFDKWGVESFNFGMGLFNFVNTLLIVVFIIFMQESTHRIGALLVGHKTEYKHWIPGIIASIVIVIISNGRLQLAVPGAIMISHLPIHRLGKFQYGPKYITMAWISALGPIGCVIAALLFKILSGIASNASLLMGAMDIALVFAVVGLLPFPPFDGHRIFFGSRYLYAFITGSILIAGLSMHFFGVFGTIMAAIFSGAACAMLYFVYVDKKF